MDQGRASHVTPPLRVGTATTRIRLYSATTLSQATALPADFAGQYLRVRAEGGDVDWFVSSLSTAAVDRTVAAAADGAASTSLGDRLPAGDSDYVVVPETVGATQYIVRQAAVSTAALRVTQVTG